MRRRSLLLGLLAAAIAASSLVPRALDLDEGFTVDEKLWIERSDRFVGAVFDGRLGQAFETGHPGVTTMWVAGLAQRTLPSDAGLRDRYSRARVWMAVADAALILLIWWILRGLAGEVVAAFGAFLLAFDPFLLAHNRVVHLDGLLALLMIASFTALLRASRDDDRRMLLLSGALGGLAALTKQPAVFPLPATVVVLWRDGKGIRSRLLRWLGAAAAGFVVLWPMMWVRPWKAAALLVTGAAGGIENPEAASFFLGRPVENAPPHFYPVILAWRSSLLTLPAGIATAVWAARRRRSSPDAATALALLLFAVGFIAMMTVGFKKGDRYILPAFAALDVAVAIAVARALGWMDARLAARAAPGTPGAAVAAAGVALAVAVHGGPALAVHPYELSHFNWAVGGPRTAHRVMIVGWGEGLDRAAEFLNTLPGAEQAVVATTRKTNFEEFFAGTTIGMADERPADLALFYISSIQAGRFPQAWARFADQTPFFQVTLNGLPYVRVYRTGEATPTRSSPEASR